MPRLAAAAPPEKLAYVALLNPRKDGLPDPIGVVDLDPGSLSYGTVVGKVDMPNAGDELHHFGWNACSACLCPYAPHPHTERRYLVVPGIRSSRIHIIDTKPDPRKPKIIKVIEPEVLAARTGYSRPHTVHCGPNGIFLSALGAPDGEGPRGIFILDPDSFEVLGNLVEKQRSWWATPNLRCCLLGLPVALSKKRSVKLVRGEDMDWKEHGVKIVHAGELDTNTPQTSGMTRAAAITHARTGANKLWAGTMVVRPDAKTGPHHHGELETVLYVVRGRVRMRWGDHLELSEEAQPGDFIYVPPYVPHQEINASANEICEAVVIRNGQDPIVVNLGVETPEPASEGHPGMPFHPNG